MSTGHNPWQGRPTYWPFPICPYPTGKVAHTRTDRHGIVIDHDGWDILVRWDGKRRATWHDCETLRSA